MTLQNQDIRQEAASETKNVTTTTIAERPTFPPPSIITPTLYCLGGVPCDAPQVTNPTVTKESNNNTFPEDTNKQQEPLPTIGSTANPCSNVAIASTTTDTNSILHHKHGGGFFQWMFEFFMKMLELILRLLLGGQLPNNPSPNQPYPTTLPTTQPTIADQPSQPEPTVVPCPDPTVDVEPTPEPTVNEPSPAPTVAQATPPVGGEQPDPSDCTTTAAEKYGWGEPQYQSHFTGNTLDPTWHPYGPEPGHQKEGERTPEQIKVENGNVTLYGADGGKTAAMSWFPGQKYGRWEGCMKVSPESGYNALFLHWSDDETWGNGGGEIDWAEIFENRNGVNYFLHCGDGGNCDTGSTQHDTTEWTAYAMEWTPNKITTYINGEVWAETTDRSILPPRPMHWCIQLDWFGRSGTSWMSVDWTKQWALPESEPSSLGLKPGEPATGQPGDYPDRKPRAMPIADMLP